MTADYNKTDAKQIKVFKLQNLSEVSKHQTYFIARRKQYQKRSLNQSSMHAKDKKQK